MTSSNLMVLPYMAVLMGKCAASQIIQAMKIDNNTFGYFLFYRYSRRIIWLEVSTTMTQMSFCFYTCWLY